MEEARTRDSHNQTSVIWVAACTLLAWVGLFIHNRADLPQLSLLSPETTIPMGIFLLLFLGWWLLPRKRLMGLGLLSWAVLNLLGGGVLSVIPFPLWPFHPEQTVFHYLMHVQYTLTQIPLVVILLRQTRCSANSKGWSDAKAHRLCNEGIEE